jgi:hypothetical protein
VTLGQWVFQNMAGEVAIARLRRYLGELQPGARALLAAELERALLRGEEALGASFILDELRRDLRRAAEPAGPVAPRAGHPQRLFCAPLTPFLIDQTDARYLGRVSRASLDPVWRWLCRDVVSAEAKDYADEINLLLAADEIASAEQAARRFQDVVVERLRETLAAAKSDEKAARRLSAQIGLREGVEDLREIYAVLRSRDALAVVASRLPPVIGSLADEQLGNVKALLDSPVGCHPDVFLYALVVVMGRLAAPSQLIRLAIRAANSDAAARIAQTPYASAVALVIAEIDRAIAAMRAALDAGRSAQVAPLIKDVHDAARALHTELDLSGDLPWGRALAAARGEAAALLQDEIETIPGRVRRLLRPRMAEEATRALDAAEVAEAEAALDLFVACRSYAGELALSESTRRVDSELQNFFDSGTQILLDGLRAAGAAERAGRQSQVDAAVRFCAKLFGAEYAALLGKAAEVAGKGEARAVRA